MAHENVGHRARLRERMMREGVDNFQDHEVLEFLLFQYLPRKDTNKIAHNLLTQFGGFDGVLDASPQQLMTVKGISEVTACNISIIKEILVRYRRCQAAKIVLHDMDSIIKYVSKMVEDNYYERLVVVYVDHSTKYLYSESFTSGSDSKVNVSVKEIVSSALRTNAAGVVLAHCHVKGVVKPSQADKDFTSQLFVALASMDIMLLDHIIFNSDGERFSFFKEKLIDELAEKYKSTF